jgi:hypothetical protein
MGFDSGETSFFGSSSYEHSVVFGEVPLVFTVRRVTDVDIGSILSSGDGAVSMDVDVVLTINLSRGHLPGVIAHGDPRIFMVASSVVPSCLVLTRFARGGIDDPLFVGSKLVRDLASSRNEPAVAVSGSEHEVGEFVLVEFSGEGSVGLMGVGIEVAVSLTSSKRITGGMPSASSLNSADELPTVGLEVVEGRVHLSPLEVLSAEGVAVSRLSSSGSLSFSILDPVVLASRSFDLVSACLATTESFFKVSISIAVLDEAVASVIESLSSSSHDGG